MDETRQNWVVTCSIVARIRESQHKETTWSTSNMPGSRYQARVTTTWSQVIRRLPVDEKLIFSTVSSEGLYLHCHFPLSIS